jgi:molybdate-binding protein/DNA-binding XRE family transcriptional regulator
MKEQVQVTNHVRRWRERLNFSQEQLAHRIGTSRQTINAIEAGRTMPSTVIALRLAAILACRVEDLFEIPGSDEEVIAHLPRAHHEVAVRTRVQLSTIHGRTVAVPLLGSLGATAALPDADGIVYGRRGTAVRVRLTVPRDRMSDTVVIAGCDPTTPVVAGHLHRLHSRFGLRWLPAGSLQALRWLREGAAHVAGIHLQGARVGQTNASAVRRVLRGMDVTVVRFVTWEQGLIVAPHNPRGIHSVADLARRGVSIVNRERGSGARALLDAELARHGVPPGRIAGYAREAFSHMAVAQAVASNLVDAGIGIRVAARVHGLTFLPLQTEAYDLVIPRSLLAEPPVEGLLDTMRRHAVRRELEAAGDYDTSELGKGLPVVV